MIKPIVFSNTKRYLSKLFHVHPMGCTSFHTTTSIYASASSSKSNKSSTSSTSSGGSRKKGKNLSDKRYQLLKHMMYGSLHHRIIPTLSDQGKEQHELIERMWCLEKEREEIALRQKLKDQYVSMRNAMEALEKMDQRLFEEAVRKEELDVPEGEKGCLVTFPTKLRAPTETLPIDRYEERLKSFGKQV